jgi:hypothetical protein
LRGGAGGGGVEKKTFYFVLDEIGHIQGGMAVDLFCFKCPVVVGTGT